MFVEDKSDDRTIVRRVVSRSDEDYLDMVRFKLNPPIVSTVMGEVSESSVSNALMKLWKKFGEGDLPEIKYLPM